MYITMPKAGTRAVHRWLTGRREVGKVESRRSPPREIFSSFESLEKPRSPPQRTRERENWRTRVKEFFKIRDGEESVQNRRTKKDLHLHRSRMIVIAWSFFVVVSLLLATNQAFLTAPLSAHGVSSYDITGSLKQFDRKDGALKASENTGQPEDPDAEDVLEDQQAVYVIEFETDRREKDDDTRKKGKDGSNGMDGQSSPLDPWSIVWYIGSFGGLVAFFLIVSCSEWCCRRNGRPLSSQYGQRGEVMNGRPTVTETPPPPYHLFAPPPYDSVNYGDIVDKTSGEKLNIYVISVPIHRPVVQAPA